MRYVVLFSGAQKLMANSVWTYTITTLLLNQWKTFAQEFTSDVDSA